MKLRTTKSNALWLIATAAILAAWMANHRRIQGRKDELDRAMVQLVDMQQRLKVIEAKVLISPEKSP